MRFSPRTNTFLCTLTPSIDESPFCSFDELHARAETVYVPGGSTQNAIRICQWVLGRPRVCVYVGCIGNDKYGRILAQKALDAGVDTHFQINETQKTGTCAVLLYQLNR